MQTSNLQERIDSTPAATDEVAPSINNHAERRTFLFILSSLVLCACLSIWIMQNSVNAYYQQTYHQPSPLVDLDNYPGWSLGGEIGDQLYLQHDLVKAQINTWNANIINNFNVDYAYTPEFKTALLVKQKKEQLRLAAEAKARAAHEAQARANEAQLNAFSMTKSDQVFFAGDSMMQGVAPHVQKYLQEQFEIKTINLSKQSTGLSYPKLFNWPATIKETIAAHPDIKILVVFLGPNDPWDMPNPAGGAYLKFKSPEWEAVYRGYIAEIIQNAQQHQVQVMWVSPPNMRKESLNEQMIYLSQVIRDEVQKQQAFLIDARDVLGTRNNIYSDYLNGNASLSKVRSADGTHFSPEGQKEFAKVIEQHIRIVS